MEAGFDVKRVIHMLILQEKEGYTFYREAAEAMADSKAKKLFEKLAKDEARHEEDFTKLLHKAPDKPLTGMSPQDLAYIELLLQRFTPLNSEKLERAKKSWSKDEALSIAEGMERNAIMLLNEIMSLDARLSLEKVLRNALAEERQHLAAIMQSKMDTAAASLML